MMSLQLVLYQVSTGLGNHETLVPLNVSSVFGGNAAIVAFTGSLLL